MAVPEAAAVAVKSTTGMLTAAGVWAGVIMFTLVLLITAIKVWPKLRELDIGRRKSDLEDLRHRIAELEKKVEDGNRLLSEARDQANQTVVEMQNKVNVTESKLIAVIAAFQLVTSDLRRHDPNSAALAQAQELVAMAVTGDFGMDRALAKLAVTKGV